MTKAIVLAGSLNNGRLKECSSAPNEALIKIDNKYMIEYVIEALQGAEKIDGILISGPKKHLQEIFKEGPGLQLVENGQTIIQSLENAVNILNDKENRILVVTSDIPLITGGIIDSFLEKCQGLEEDIVYPIVAKILNQAKFPEVKRTYAKLQEGTYTGGNIFLINPEIVKPCANKAEEVVKLRKSPLKLVKYIGFTYFLKYITGNLSIKDVEERVSQLFNIKGKAIPVSFPEISVDVDKPSDLELVENYFKKSSV
ncbi:MAG: nucleotidyltransferase family protein [Peptococcales bacterium]